MPKINLLTIQPGDSQATLIDKSNYNWDQILSAGGGPRGLQGPQGSTGSIGPQGLQGLVGPQGLEGTRWYVVPSTTGGSGPTGSAYLGAPISGDYWMDALSREIFIYGVTGSGMDWLDTGYNLRSESIFSRTDSNPSTTSLGVFDSDVVTYSEVDPDKFSFLVSDWGVSSGSSIYTGPSSYGLNSEKSKFKISTSLITSYPNLVSFGRADFDSANSGSNSFSNTHNPVIKWAVAGTTGSTPSSTGIWDVDFYNPIGDWNFRTTAGKTLLSSSTLNKISTSDSAGGTLVTFSSNGFLQAAASGSGFSSTPYFSVTPIGLGVKTNPGPNNFSVKGASSFAQTDAFNSYAFPVGTVGIENGLRIGATGFNPYGIPASYTGPIPKLMVSGNSTGSGSIIRASFDTPGSLTNGTLYWGDSSGYLPSSSANVLAQEFIDPSSTLSPSSVYAGYYHSYGSVAGSTATNTTQFSIESVLGQTTLQVRGNSTNLYLYANPFAGPGRIISNANGVESMVAYSSGVKISPSDSYTPPNPAKSTKLSVENGGVYIGGGSATPDVTNNYVSGDNMTSDMGWLSWMKMTSGLDQTWNGINIETFTNDHSSSLITANRTKAFVINNNYTPLIGSPTKSILYYVDYYGNVLSGNNTAQGNLSVAGTSNLAGNIIVNQSGTTSIDPAFGVTYGPGGVKTSLFIYGYGTSSAGTTGTDGGISLQGNMRITGEVFHPSSLRWKENITPLEGSLSVINSLRPVNFQWKGNKKDDTGFIAEEVNEILPEIVDIDEDGSAKGLAVSKLIPYLVQSVKELTDLVKDLRKEINELKEKNDK